MGNLAVRAQGLGKRYQLGQTKRTDIGSRSTGDEFWALRDVSFEIEHGEIVGIIGGNGAGKSTLLKILSRITEPTTGYADIHGRVGSLLEVGTGFHPDLTGRENIYLNGAILGMKRAEIRRKFDEIVAFAEIEKFIDTPVKRYSSGMYVRLAFAVAANLQPEILIVDEVLAVGDAAFQKKCLGKMGEAAGSGRTVLFVSHNFEAIKSLCTRCLLLDQGEVIEDSTPVVSIEKALAQLRMLTTTAGFELQTFRDGPEIPQPIAVDVRAVGKAPGDLITFTDDICVGLSLDAPIQEEQTFSLAVFTSTGVPVFNSFYRDNSANPPLQPGRTSSISTTIPQQLLPSGVYEAVFGCMLPNAEQLWVTRNTWFEVHEIESYRNEGLTVKRIGLVSIVLPWEAS